MTISQAASTVKQNLAALRMHFEHLRLPTDNLSEGVRGAKHVVQKGRTPVLSGDETPQILESIDIPSLAGLQDLALIGLMVFTFARVSAAIGEASRSRWTRSAGSVLD